MRRFLVHRFLNAQRDLIKHDFSEHSCADFSRADLTSANSRTDFSCACSSCSGSLFILSGSWRSGDFAIAANPVSARRRFSDSVVEELAVGLVHAGVCLLQEEEAIVLVAPRPNFNPDVADHLVHVMPDFNGIPSESLLLRR